MISLDKFVGDVFVVEYNQTYNRKAYKFTPEADTTLVVGSPIMEDTTFVGFSLINGMVKATETVEIGIMDNGFGVVVNSSELPDTVTEAVKTAAIAKGFKFI